MPFAVELYFDAPLSEAVTDLEARIDATGPGPSLRGLGFTPHISLLTCADTAEDDARHVIRSVAHTWAPVPISLEAVGAFPPEGATVFLAPAASAPLVSLHATVWSRIRAAARDPSPLYAPGRWVPHCTVAQGVPPSSRARVLAVTAAAGLPLRGHLVAIGLTGDRPAVPVFRFPLSGLAAPSLDNPDSTA